MVKVVVTDREGQVVEVEAQTGISLMENIRELDNSVDAICGGLCSCATCHIYVDVLQWPQLKIKDNSLEQELLEYEKGYITDKSRLACQIQLNDELNNVTVKLINDELL